MRFLFRRFLVVVLGILMTSQVASAAFSGSGAGSSEDPFQITSVDELLEINDYLGSSNSGVYWKLMNDLDLSDYSDGSGWDPIGSASSSSGYFYGKFDGDYKTIDNLTINRSAEDNVGLIAYITSGAIFEKVLFSNITLSGDYAVGAVTGRNSGTVRYVGVEDGTVSGLMRVGGVIGENRGTASQIFSRGLTVTQRSASIDCCVGGITGGTEFGGSIADSYARTDVVHTENGQAAIGGAVGNTYNSSGITRIYSTGEVSSLDPSPPANIGGLTGVNYVAATNSYWDTETSGTSSSASGTGKTSSEMKEEDTYSGWDFDSVWDIAAGTNDGYPSLRWETNLVSNPLVSSLSPADNATSIAVDANLVISFNKAVDAESGNIVIYNSDDEVVETIDVTSGQVTGSGTSSITINPTSDFSSATEYYVQIAASAFDDAEGNSYAGISDDTTWSFTIVDLDAPLVTTLSPLDDATSVSATTNFSITFDEAVEIGTGTFRVYNAEDDALVISVDVTGDEVSGGSSSTITVNPEQPLLPGASYYIQISDTAFEDAVGNSYAGISDTTTWSFSTASASTPSGRVTITPSSVSLDENGGSQAITFSLDEPIISGEDPEGLTLYLLSSDTDEFTLSTSSLLWENDADWAEDRTVTLVAVDDDLDLDQSASLFWIISASSEYYDASSGTLSITLNDDDAVASTPTVTATSSVIAHGCADPKAENYRPGVEHLAKICRYTTENISQELTRLLREGDRGQDVRMVQKALNESGLLEELLLEDGIFGKRTAFAARMFQDHHALLVDAIVGPQTWFLLR